MTVLSSAQFSALIERIFQHSPQALLAINGTKISYSNRAAVDLLGMNPTGFPLINCVDASFATYLNSDTGDALPKTQRAKFFDHYYDILPLLLHETTLLFLYPPDAAYDTKHLLRDTLSIFGALTGSAKRALDLEETEVLKSTLAQSSLAVKALEYMRSASLSAYDFITLFEYAMNSFSDLSEHGCFTISITRNNMNTLVALDSRLMHAALVSAVFDLLRLCKDCGVLSISCSNSKNNVTLKFSCNRVKFPKDLQPLLLSPGSGATTEILEKFGASLFLSKHIFALHKASLQLDNAGSGFALTLSFPCAIQPPTLYAETSVARDFPTPFSLSRKEIAEYFLNSEKA